MENYFKTLNSALKIHRYFFGKTIESFSIEILKALQNSISKNVAELKILLDDVELDWLIITVATEIHKKEHEETN